MTELKGPTNTQKIMGIEHLVSIIGQKEVELIGLKELLREKDEIIKKLENKHE